MAAFRRCEWKIRSLSAMTRKSEYMRAIEFPFSMRKDSQR